MLPHSMGSKAPLLRRSFLVPLFAISAIAWAAAASHPAFAQTATTTTLAITSGSSAATSVSAGTVVTLTAKVVAGTTPVTPGQVKFCDASVSYCTDIHLLGLAQLTSSGTAVFKFRPGGGSRSYKAVFLGTKTYAGSASSVSALTVAAPYITTTQIQQSYQGNSWNLSVNVAGGLSAPSLAAPTGTVSLIDTNNGNSVAATANLTGSSITTSLVYRNDNYIGQYGTYTAPELPGFICETVADFNGDGIPDVAGVLFEESGYFLILYTGNSDGTFKQGKSIQLPISYIQGLGQMLVADFNGDGIPDIAVQSLQDGKAGFDVVLVSADGSLTLSTLTPPTPATGIGFASLAGAVADFNGDGIPDLAIIAADNSIYIWLGNGDGTFTGSSTNPTLPNTPTSIQAADFNGDGKADLLVVNGGQISILLGNGDGTFTNKSAISVSNFDAVEIADFNGHGILDLAVMTGGNYVSGSFIPLTITTFEGNGDGTFTQEATLSTQGLQQFDFAVGDFNGDGIPDMVAINGAGNGCVIDNVYLPCPSPNFFDLYLGNGDGTFQANQNLPSPGSILIDTVFGGEPLIAVADLNGDGISDLVFPMENILGEVLGQAGWTATATLTDFNPSLATHVYTAEYTGDSTYASSTSNSTTITPQIPTIISPTPGTTLYTNTATFTWGVGTGVTQYKLDLGTTGPESSDIYAGSPTTSTSVTVTDIPLNGGTVYATLYSYVGGTWVPIQVTYTTPLAPVLTTPAPGSHLSSSTVTFQWSPGGGVTGYEIAVGTNWPGSNDIYGSSVLQSTSATVSGLPTNGVTVYVMLRYQINGAWYASFYTYTAEGTTAPPAMTSPAPGSHLTSSTPTFQWSPGSGVTAYEIAVGTKWPGSNDIYGSSVLQSTSATVSGLPTNGVTVYVTLRYQIEGVWSDLFYTYTAEGTTAPPAMISPAPGSQLSGSNVTFQWTPGSGVTGYALSVGTYGPDGCNIYSSPLLTTTSGTVPGIPTNGKPVYVTLWYQIDGVWKTLGYTYTAQ